MVFCDISKAFDRVWHKRLLFKLKQNGIDAPLLAWFENYLSYRQLSVIVGNAKSRPLTINTWVPQGSVLGPLLFLVYVNDVTENIFSISRLLAADTSMTCCATSITDTEGILNNELLKLSTWAKQWLVSFNPSKSVAMLFTNKAVPFTRLVFDNVVLAFVKSHKHLGLTLSSNTKLKDHIHIPKSASKVLCMMRAFKFRKK